MSVYEVCDTTDDEIHFPLGIFNTLDDVRHELAKFDSAKERVSDRAEEHETISVYERDIGWSEHGQAVLVIEREEYYCESDDEYYWRTIVS